MQELNQKLNQTVPNNQSSLDDIVALAEHAANVIAQLRAENELLVREIAYFQLTTTVQATEAERAQQAIKELLQSSLAMTEAATWYQWFHEKFGNTVFYSNIALSYQNDHPDRQPTTKPATDESTE